MTVTSGRVVKDAPRLQIPGFPDARQRKSHPNDPPRICDSSWRAVRLLDRAGAGSAAGALAGVDTRLRYATGVA